MEEKGKDQGGIPWYIFPGGALGGVCMVQYDCIPPHDWGAS